MVPSRCACNHGQHLLNPRTCSYLSTKEAASNPDVEVAATLRALLRPSSDDGVYTVSLPSTPLPTADLSLQVTGGPLSEARPIPAAVVTDDHVAVGGHLPPSSTPPLPLPAPAHHHPLIPKRKVHKPWLHDAIGADGACRFCGAFITSPNTSVRKRHLLNPKACK